MILKGNTHCHTTKSDGNHSPIQMIKAFNALSYDFLFLTDHNSDFRYGETEHIPRPHIPRPDSGLIVFYGTELSNDPDVRQHVVQVESDGIKVRILAHPNRYKNTVDEVKNMMRKYSLDATECTEHGKYYPKYNIENSVVSDDAHNFRMIGDAFVAIETESRDAGGVLDSLKSSQNILKSGVQFEKSFIRNNFKKATGV